MSLGAGEWNASAGRRWNALRGALRRQYPGLEFFRAVELQVRGVIHLHVIVWSPRRPVRGPVAQRLALEAGFGCNVKVQHAGDDVTRFARYVTKYVTKSTDDRSDCPWTVLDEDTGELVEQTATYRTWSQSQGFGCRMRDHVEAIASDKRRAVDRLRLNVSGVLDVLGATIIGGDSWGFDDLRSVKPPGLPVS